MLYVSTTNVEYCAEKKAALNNGWQSSIRDMDWKSWSLEKWNTALVDAVFLAEGRAGTTISRIDASARFLARCTDTPNCEPDEAKHAFIRSFGASANTIRDLYKWPSTRPLPRGKNIPRSFAALYLTLMAGSADDGTYDVGEFRHRFIELLSPTVPTAAKHLNLPFSDLPDMWRYVARWSLERQRELGDCGVLKLPSVPASERLIGYSKRIAFPTYKDEVRLKKLLEETQLSQNAEFRQVIRALRARIDQFSASFVFVFESFASLVSEHRLEEAYESQFWGLIRDITLDASGLTHRVKGKYCLQLDVGDTFDPIPYLFFDDVGRDRLSLTLKSLAVQRRDGLTHVAIVDDAYPPMARLSEALRSPRVAGTKLERFFDAGWITLLPDALGALSTDGEYSDGGQACFMVRSGFVGQLELAMKHLGVQYLQLDAGTAISGWFGFLCKEVSKYGFNRILSIAPASVARLVRAGWSPPRVSLAGGAWHGQALLLNPASNPVASMVGATAGYLRFLDANGDEVQGGGCLEVAVNGFRASPSLVAELPATAHSCEYSLRDNDGTAKHLRVYLARTVPHSRPIPIRSPSRWLCDGSSGSLQPLMGDGIELLNPRSIGAARTFVGLLPNAVRSTMVGAEWSTVGVSELPKALEWLSEALLLRFQSCGSMSFSQLMDHVNGAAEAAKLPPKLLRRLLVEGQWLLPLQRQGAPVSSVAASPRLAALREIGEGVCLRITGMFGASDFAAIKANLLPNESSSRIVAGPLSLGCLELLLDSLERGPVMANLLGARIIEIEETPAPLTALAPTSALMAGTGAPPRHASMKPWLPHVRAWGPETSYDQPWPCGEVRQLVGTHGNGTWYWLKAGDAKFVRTDSLAWAWLAAEAVIGRPIAALLPSGEVIWSERLVGLPAVLPRWWLLFGGGCISLAPDGRTIFTGLVSAGVARGLGLRTQDERIGQSGQSKAMEHRALALRLARKRATGR